MQHRGGSRLPVTALNGILDGMTPTREDGLTMLKRRKIGMTNLEVTELGLGGAPMGGFRATISEAEATALTDAAYEGGVRYFDTSPFYGYGRSELRMGAARRERPRDEYVVSTKVGRVLHAMRPGEKPPADFRDNGLPGFAPVFDYTYDGVMRSLEHSHLRLGLARIDIALIHDVDFWTTRDRDVLEQRFRTVMDSGFRALDELRKAGVVGAIGVGINEADQLALHPGRRFRLHAAGRPLHTPRARWPTGVPAGMFETERVRDPGRSVNSGILTGGVKPGATHD